MTLLRRPGAAIATLLILVLGAAFFNPQVVPYRQIVETHRQVAAARAELAELTADNQDLQADVDALQTDAEIEKLAREKLGYVKPGETAYVVLDPPGTDDEPPARAEPEPDEKTWVDEIWEFLSGADLNS